MAVGTFIVSWTNILAAQSLRTTCLQGDYANSWNHSFSRRNYKTKIGNVPCRVASSWGFSEMTIQPARHECHACCQLRAGIPAFQPVVDNTRGTRVGQVVSSFQKFLRGSQHTWYLKTGRILQWASRRLQGELRRPLIRANSTQPIELPNLVSLPYRFRTLCSTVAKPHSAYHSKAVNATERDGVWLGDSRTE